MLIRTKKCAEGKNFLVKINEWLQEQEVSSLPLVDFRSKFLPMEVMKDIEMEATKYYNQQIRNTPKAYHLKRVPVTQVYFANPEIPWSPTKKETFHLGNRVSVLRSDEGTLYFEAIFLNLFCEFILQSTRSHDHDVIYKLIFCDFEGIPFGSRGTVVGLHDTFLEMITDTNVMKGNTLHNRCNDHRGCIVPYTSVINLTPNKQPPASVMEPEKCSESVVPHHRGNHGQNQHGMGGYNDGNHQNSRKPRGQQGRGNRNRNDRRNNHQNHMQNRMDHNMHQVHKHGNQGNFNGNQGNHRQHQRGGPNQPRQQHTNNLIMNQSMLNANNLDMHYNQQMLQNGLCFMEMPTFYLFCDVSRFEKIVCFQHEVASQLFTTSF